MKYRISGIDDWQLCFALELAIGGREAYAYIEKGRIGVWYMGEESRADEPDWDYFLNECGLDITLMRIGNESIAITTKGDRAGSIGRSSDPMRALQRAFLTAKFGDEVELPDPVPVADSDA